MAVRQIRCPSEAREAVHDPRVVAEVEAAAGQCRAVLDGPGGVERPDHPSGLQVERPHIAVQVAHEQVLRVEGGRRLHGRADVRPPGQRARLGVKRVDVVRPGADVDAVAVDRRLAQALVPGRAGVVVPQALPGPDIVGGQLAVVAVQVEAALGVGRRVLQEARRPLPEHLVGRSHRGQVGGVAGPRHRPPVDRPGRPPRLPVVVLAARRRGRRHGRVLGECVGQGVAPVHVRRLSMHGPPRQHGTAGEQQSATGADNRNDPAAAHAKTVAAAVFQPVGRLPRWRRLPSSSSASAGPGRRCCA